MERGDVARGVGAFVLAVLVVVAGTAVVGSVTGPTTDRSTQPTAPAYDTGELLPTAVADDGSVGSPDASEAKTVVVDVSHGNAVEPAAIGPLVDALVRDGHEVHLFTGGSSASTGFSTTGTSELNATLRSADAFVVVSPATPYTDDEIRGIAAFADAGGRVLMLADPVGRSGSGTSLPVPIGLPTGSSTAAGQPTNLAAAFGISFGSGYLYDMTENANNFQGVFAEPSGGTLLTNGTDRVVLRDAAPLVTDGNATAVLASEDTALSSTRKAGDYTVAARAGNVTAVGDTTFLEPGVATTADNERFVTNVARFLVTGEKAEGVPAPAGPSTPPGGGPSIGPPTAPAPPTAPNGTGSPNGTAAPATPTPTSEG
jgi:hypothetical protein